MRWRASALTKMAQQSWRFLSWLSPSAPRQQSQGRAARCQTAQNGNIAVSTEPGLTLVPSTITKTVHFIRHAEGFHNVGWEQNDDAHLTGRGWAQTAALRRHLQELTLPLNVQVVIVSPLQRTLETAAGVFGAPGGGGLLMRGQDAAPNERTAHEAIALPACGPPFVACEQCRERVGPNRCDRRRLLSSTRAQFPGVDFDFVASEDDEWWEREHAVPQSCGCYSRGESEAQCTERGVRFLKWLMSRPEQRIAVVSHAGFIRHALSAFAGGLPDAPAEALQREFSNCELRTVVLSDASVCARDATWFPGGMAAAAKGEAALAAGR
ncbi:hypothetical protein WJX81_008390 [Elliptochloris bilobata]|uniref:Phosphoglycerate mutase-like protein n=1 Tax=Elliptochloris bilobata TaxID=381761 RepID=A0AAW1S137_9CHLO